MVTAVLKLVTGVVNSKGGARVVTLEMQGSCKGHARVMQGSCKGGGKGGSKGGF
ncbi:hypothetical protein [Hanstruepera neustonica]|uniref:hypothetical protein n=1 Tax=Hanstruepera neustonica TaxID=1445657 RepID=UPI0013FD36AD|nr:hypothetical protein [Hanstruepera neustonica]